MPTTKTIGTGGDYTTLPVRDPPARRSLWRRMIIRFRRWREHRRITKMYRLFGWE